MSERAAAYSTRTSEDSLADLSKKLTEDLRRNVRSLVFCDVLTAQWIKTAESLSRIAQITNMEKELPKTEQDQTLWDGEELALKYILEDGKLNLCVRLMDSYLEYIEQCDATSLTEEQQDKCEKFSHGLAQILSNAWAHKEALQTTDMPLMIDILSRQVFTLGFVTSGEEDSGKKDPLKAFEAPAMNAFHALGKYLDRIGEERALNEIKRRKAIANFLSTLWRRPDLDKDAVLTGIEGIGFIISSEEFQTTKKDMLKRPSSRPTSGVETVADDLMKCDSVHFTPLSKESSSNKRRMRPVLDLVSFSRRQSRKK
eukprot:gb/GECG01002251.1/.p1 GENE.gb/GECG01002251.1/~~gb/GECG01002251.1/.p1  ORF type:complete len:313 (+),score=45.05 gb/GECG01002251.1/:1-939(+)